MRLNISDKLSLTLLLVVIAIAAPPAAALPAVFVVLLLRRFVRSLRPLNPGSGRRFARVTAYALLAAILMTLLNGWLMKEGEAIPVTAGIELHTGGIAFGIRTGTRLVLLLTTLLVFFDSTRIADITAFLYRLGLATSVVMVVHLSLHFIESLPERIQRIYTAQEARGAPVRSSISARVSSVFTLLSPLFLASLVESIERGKGLALRGYSSETRLAFAELESPRVSFLTVSFLAAAIVTAILPWALG